MRPLAAVRGRWTRTSLRGRVLALVLALLVLGWVVVLATSTLALRHYLYSQLDDQVRTAAGTYGHSLDRPDLDHDHDGRVDTGGQTPGTLGARIVGGQVLSGGVVHANDSTSDLSRDVADALTALRPSGSIRTVDLPGLGGYRLSITSEPDGDVLITGLPTEEVDDTVRNLLLIELVVFAVVFVATCAVGLWLVHAALRPLRSLTRTAREVSDLPLRAGPVALHNRVPDPAPGTEIGEVAGAFNHMLDHVDDALTARERSEARLRQFVADASHELRTPVAVIRGRAEYGGEDALDRIRVEADRMSTMVEDLLLLARLDDGQEPRRTDVDVTLLAIDAVDEARRAATDHRWSLDLPPGRVTVTGDPDGLRRVLQNLLANAARHTPEGTAVELCVATDAAAVRISVRDDGPGIEPALLPRVFDRFARADDARSRAAGSTGLGLSIVRSVVQAHRGSVEATSRPGRTEFVVTLPAEQETLRPRPDEPDGA